MANIQDIYEVSDKASKVLNDLGFNSHQFSISYGLEKSAQKFFYEETGFIDENSNHEEWSSDENYWGSEFQSLIANAIDNSRTMKDTFNLLFNKIKSFDNFKATDFKVKIEDKVIEEKLKEIANQNKQFEDKNENEKAVNGDQVIFDYSATVDGNKFEGSEGKGVQLELGKDLFLKGFDQQLVGVKKSDQKILDAVLPANHPKKELANKKTKFECKILNVKKPKTSKTDDEFAKLMGAKDIKDLKAMIEKQISSQYSQALNSITKKEILDQIEKNHQVDLPQNLIDQEISIMTQNLKPEEKEKHKANNEKLAKSRIKLGLLLNEYGEKNNLKVSDDEVKAEIQKQIKGMPGQEKMVLEYYQKNPNASQSLKGSLYEEKIIELIKSKINLSSKEVSSKEAEKIISEFNKPNAETSDKSKTPSPAKTKSKQKKIVKSNQ